MLTDLVTVVALVCALALAGMSWLAERVIPSPPTPGGRATRRLVMALWNTLAVVCLIAGALGLIIWR